MNTSLQRSKKRTLIAFLAFTFAQGAIGYFIAEESDVARFYQIICAVLSALFIMRWFVLDANERHFKLSKALIFTFVALALIAVPYYFIKTRGKQGFAPILLSFLFLILLGTTSIMGYFTSAFLTGGLIGETGFNG